MNSGYVPESCDSFEAAENDPGHCVNCPGYDSDHDTEDSDYARSEAKQAVIDAINAEEGA